MSGCACECSFQVEVGVAAWTRGLRKPLFGPCRKAECVVEVSCMRYAVGTWGFMGIGGSLGKHAVSSGQKADWRRAGYKRSVNAGIEDNALIVQRTTRRRSRGVITRVQRPLRPALGRSWALQGVGIRALTPWKSLWECCDKDGGEVGRKPKRMNENRMGNGNGNGDGMGSEG